jgi:hypothetical protein
MQTLTLVAAIVLTAGFTGNAAAGEAPDLNRLSWLEGSWAGSKDGIESEEHWTSVNGGALLAMHRDVKDGRMTSFEFLRIATTKEGTFYFGSPNSAPPTPFRVVDMADKRVTFENKTHDFPQRIQYWLDEHDALHARIEGPIKGESVSEEWVWKKVVR